MDDGLNLKSRPDYTYDYYDFPLLDECANYSLNGIIQFLQNEWTKVEIKTVQWEVEKAELQAKIAYLQGERKCQENLKCDLIRRIKMLEYALKLERGKLNALTGGTENLASSATIDHLINNEDNTEFDDADIYLELSKNNQKITDENSKWKDEKTRLKKMFMEINDGDEVKQSYGGAQEPSIDSLPSDDDSDGNNSMYKKHKKRSQVDDQKSSTSFIDGTFRFLSMEGIDGKAKSDLEDESVSKNEFLVDTETEETMIEFDCLVNQIQQKKFCQTENKQSVNFVENEWAKVDHSFITKMKEIYIQERGQELKNSSKPRSSPISEKVIYDVVDSGSSSDSDQSSDSSVIHESSTEFSVDGQAKVASPGSPKSACQKGQLTEELSLGDLASLTVANEGGFIISDPDSSPQLHAEKNVGNSSAARNEKLAKKTWTARFNLRSHFDGIRSIIFHPFQPLLISGSEDFTLKLWNLTKTIPSKKGSVGLDVEPVYTYRGHKSPVLSLCLTEKLIFSGSLDGEIRIWKIPESMDPYDSFDHSLCLPVLFQHSDAVWSLCSIKNDKLLSASSDGSVKCWLIEEGILTDLRVNGSQKCLLYNYTFGTLGNPTCLAISYDHDEHFAVGFTTGNSGIFGLNNGHLLRKFQLPQASDGTESSASTTGQVNCLVVHPLKPMTIIGYDDSCIRCFDNTSGDIICTLAAHQLAVTSLAVDSSGTFLISGSHDTAVRVWNINTWVCLQEITSHRKKFDEAIHYISFHPSKNLFATAGADALAKVFI